MTRLLSFRHALSSPPGLIVICFSIFYLALFQYCRHASSFDPTSTFFDPSRAYERGYSNERIEQAEKFLETAGTLPPAQRDAAVPPIVCLGIPTIARDGEQYVRKTIGSLLEGLTAEERQDLYVNIFIAHTEPSKHPIYHEKWIETLPNKLLGYKHTDLSMVREWEETSEYRPKSIFDYTHLLQDCYDTGAKYIIMVEDDVLAVRGWYSRTISSLNYVESEMGKRNSDSKWLYMRLFYTDEMLGWNSEFWATYLFQSLLIWALLLAILVGARSRSRNLQKVLSNLSIGIITCVCLPALIGLYFMSGRNFVLPLAPGIQEMNAFGCCSQGYVYPREIIPSFINKTDLTTDWLVDMMVEQISDKEGYVRWATVPALLQHIGMKSSKGYGFDELAQRIWNFGFEAHKGA